MKFNEKNKLNHLNTLPNLLTGLRILLIPVLFVVFYLPFSWAKPASAGIFLLAALTDWVDGYIARKFNQYSKFGEFLDPVADKLMVAVALVILVAHDPKDPSPFIAIPAAIIICREIAISALREWMAELGKRAKIRVSVIGKYKTAMQMTAITLLLYNQPSFGLPVFFIGLALLQIAALLTLISMLIYLKAAWPYFFTET